MDIEVGDGPMDATGAGKVTVTRLLHNPFCYECVGTYLVIQRRYLGIYPGWIAHTDVEQTYFLYTHGR
jgi:hypothetical protein